MGKAWVEAAEQGRARLVLEVSPDELRADTGLGLTAPPFSEIGLRAVESLAAHTAVGTGAAEGILQCIHHFVPVEPCDITVSEPSSSAGAGRPWRIVLTWPPRPAIVLPDLSTVEVTVPSLPQPGPDDVDAWLERTRREFVDINEVSRPAAWGDLVHLRLSTSDGGVAEVHHEIGSAQRLPGLDEALLGLSAGDSAVFSIVVTIQVLSVFEMRTAEVDDALATAVAGCSTIAELRGLVTAHLVRAQVERGLRLARDAALDCLAELSWVPNEHERQSLREFVAGEQPDEARARRLCGRMILDAVADRHGIGVDHEDLALTAAKRSNLPLSRLYAYTRRAKALALVLDCVVVQPPAGA